MTGALTPQFNYFTERKHRSSNFKPILIFNIKHSLFSTKSVVISELLAKYI